MTFKDDLREVLDSLEPDGKRINGKDQAEAKITKLVEGLIGEKDNTSLQATDDPSISVFLQGKNKLRAQIHQRLRG